MNTTHRPSDPAPGGMGGATRMHDLSEAAHDRVRRRCMNIAFIIIVALIFVQVRLTGIHGWGWLSAVLLAIAGMPSAMAVKMFELRFKMAREERRHALGDLPAMKQIEFVIYVLLATGALVLRAEFASWALLGVWLYDFFTYYHDRPERMRHLYAVTKTLDELREFPAPWAWALPALAWALLSKA
jgi:hypothetical protein